MNQQTIEEIVRELSDHLTGRFLGRIFQISPLSLALDFGLRNAFLFISIDPAAPRVYLITQTSRQLEKESISAMQFAQVMRSILGGARLLSLAKVQSERVVRFSFSREDELGETKHVEMIVQLTGRSANLLLLNQEGLITHALRPPKGEGQQIGEEYQPPRSQPGQPLRTGLDLEKDGPIEKGDSPTWSAAADDYYRRRDSAADFETRSKTLQDKIKKELAQALKLRKNLQKDLSSHGDPEQHKRHGDLLLANIANATRVGNKVKLKDYYSEGAPEIEIEVEENASLQDEAARYFARFAKGKRAAEEISARLNTLAETINRLEERKIEIDRILNERDEDALNRIEGIGSQKATAKFKSPSPEKIPGVRRYRSSDGYEILVGRAAQTNDRLTFRIARPHDWWLHAADYPGSHVVIRNHTRAEIPHRTLIEAAQIAAKFSQAGDDSRVTVHYTQRKFLSKPKGAAPGLVRMSSVRTIVVQPGENVPRIL
ncbi:MAG TPA: NFACT family protein [Pyrinomonadaceae bacterium]|nr:NFACT family protein [Pyrinomonadaceae bacterium]